MCTIIALFGVRPQGELWIATNRDELYARPTSGPLLLEREPPIVGGRDLAGPGTWMGVTRSGMFVGVTNQRGGGRDPDRRSRGEIVIEALRRGTVTEARRYVESLDGRAYNEFNLMWGDANLLYVGYGRSHEQQVEIEAVKPGLHVLPNDRLDSADFVKVARIRELLATHVEEADEQLASALKAALADGLLPPIERLPKAPEGLQLDPAFLQRLAAVNVSTPHYGTRSSTVVALADGRVLRFDYAEGPPDVATFVDVRGLYPLQ